MKIPLRLTAVFEESEEGYKAYFEEIPGVNIYGNTLDEAKSKLAEAYKTEVETNISH
jgi:predicted RNase H-like HicB family nuclease